MTPSIRNDKVFYKQKSGVGYLGSTDFLVICPG